MFWWYSHRCQPLNSSGPLSYQKHLWLIKSMQMLMVSLWGKWKHNKPLCWKSLPNEAQEKQDVTKIDRVLCYGAITGSSLTENKVPIWVDSPPSHGEVEESGYEKFKWDCEFLVWICALSRDMAMSYSDVCSPWMIQILQFNLLWPNSTCIGERSAYMCGRTESWCLR